MFVTRDVEFVETNSYYSNSQDYLEDIFPLPFASYQLSNKSNSSHTSADVSIDTSYLVSIAESANTDLEKKYSQC